MYDDSFNRIISLLVGTPIHTCWPITSPEAATLLILTFTAPPLLRSSPPPPLLPTNRQHRRTGQVTYGQSYAGYNPAAAGGAALDGSDSDSDEDSNKKPAAPAPIVVNHQYPAQQQYPAQYPPGVGYMPSPVHPMGFAPSPVPYGMSPVAMYPAAPWNAGMPASPVPVQVPEFIKRQVRRWKNMHTCCANDRCESFSRWIRGERRHRARVAVCGGWWWSLSSF